ncbi:diaminopimelate epimerase [Brachybacterium sp. J144]|uniref:diaminopimelate epimerase n=1 Tax=Brachybacterium sp. J144 TaxID=3116487 RepID=UPI002E76A54A|nr:diaminopimelate epimerase [Brachybacterium sp. J144]MEE1649215.1 diaminopimelate epimerase [Brachybacterium sp. J144]
MTEPLRFTKGHGTENDFVILDDPDGELALDAAAVAALADRRAGIGGDGVIRAVRTRHAGIDAPKDAPEWFMDYRNGDGSLAEMCGNGVRVFAAHLQRAGHVHEDSFPIWTRAGVRTIEVLSRPAAGDPAVWRVRVGMGRSRSERSGRTVEIAGHRLDVLDVDMGNPHAVAFLPAGLALEDLDLTRRPALDPEPADGANIELVAERGDHHVAMRVHERGVGETRSCGTGVAAVAVASALRAGDTDARPWIVDVPGGRLEVSWGVDGEVLLTGAAELVADGTLLPRP